jgi:hypothetical protein
MLLRKTLTTLHPARTRKVDTGAIRRLSRVGKRAPCGKQRSPFVSKLNVSGEQMECRPSANCMPSPLHLHVRGQTRVST